MKLKYNTIIVNDMEESVNFYRDVLGFKVHSELNPQPEVSITMMKGEGDVIIELIKNPVNETGLASIGMEIEDMTETIEDLRSKGATIRTEPVPISHGMLAFIEDPNGVNIALIQHNP